MLRWLALCLCLLISPSLAQAEGGSISVADTDVFGIYTPQMVISDDRHHVLMGHVIVATGRGETTRALVIHQRRDGVHRLRYREAWSQGLELPYASFAGRGLGCTHGHCRDNQVGMIYLSPAAFSFAERHGLHARLIGPSGAILVTAPPSLFVEARRMAAASGIQP